MRLTILFEAPYWIGLVELERDGLLYVGRHIFGAEPSDQTVYDFVQNDLLSVLKGLTVGVPVYSAKAPHINPKRMQREIRRELAQHGIATRSQEALQLQLKQNKQTRRQTSREERKAHEEHRRDVARARARAKHRGH